MSNRFHDIQHVIQNVGPDYDIDGLDDGELLSYHILLHSLWREVDVQGRDVNGWEKDTLVDAHADVEDEIHRRGLPDEIDEDIDAEPEEQESDPVLDVELETKKEPKPDFGSDTEAVRWAMDQSDSWMTIPDIMKETDLSYVFVEMAVDDLEDNGEIEQVAEGLNGKLWRVGEPEPEPESESERPGPDEVEALATTIIEESDIFATKDSVENLRRWR